MPRSQGLTDGRVGEHDRRDVLVVQLQVLFVVEDAVSKSSSGGDGH